MWQKKHVVIWSALLINVGALVCGVFAPPYLSGADTKGDVMTVTVSGDGIVEVIPDLAYLTFGVTTRKITAEEAQTVNAMTMSVNTVRVRIRKKPVKPERLA